MMESLTPDSPVLVVEDDDSTAELARRSLVRARRVVRGARRVDEALNLLSRERFGFAILDYRLEDGFAWPVLDAARAASPPIPVVLVTAAGDERVAAEAFHRGASEYVIKTGEFWERLPGIIERLGRAAEAERRNSLLAAVARFSAEAILAGAMDGTIWAWNVGAERLFGYAPEEILGHSARVLFPPDRLDEFEAAWEALRAGGQVSNPDAVRRRKDGTPLDVAETISPMLDAKGQVIGAAIIARDIREQKRLEAQFRQAQKMEAVGRLAGGVAHDFNNLLTVITGYSDLLLATLPADGHARNAVTEIRHAGERAAALTRQLLSFSRSQRTSPGVQDLGEVVRGAQALLGRLIGEDLEFVLQLHDGILPFVADPNQIGQVITNLVVNARDAMPAGGRLTIRTAPALLSPEDVADHQGVASGQFVLLEVEDSGVGMSPAVLQHLFEPFFTTKAPGRGTGLGLSTAYGIVQGSGGFIDVRSAPGKGTLMRVFLPRTARPFVQKPVAPAPVQREHEALTVLVVDDDAAIRRMVQTILTKQGYEVLPAQDGADALAVAGSRQGRIDLLLTDVAMRRLGGPELASRLVSLRPEMRVLFISGYSDSPATRISPNDAFLDKPFTPASLLEKIDAVLGLDAGATPPRSGS